ncbi:MAG TPA: pyridoxal phosphate-dependent aminotransferase [Bacteroidales bacterium]|jgi:aspartate aminotransferase|nr:pyridoxal phosphate-dependent aminotransferase [Bacteroidales bacterium]HOF15684.1 pyridoxal phosphate-dependent aminotransferase [Bacteroidales bacterium]HON20016.1 pyridoxal phosphate-dependent aminotransferase [Bacteroidales bacterium]HOR81344.1 pyridoxal phosphate-dependent aminotransferase [Bacteroidales bacterium]HPJ90822.1 pyridoxal phosphate-dependent aminotransferase [Bacteroidales bacterium]
MEILADRILQMSESETLAMTRIARELKAQGKDVISLSIGEPDFNTPEIIKEAGKKAIDDNYTHYPPVPGYADLREAISKKFKRDNNLDYKPEQIVVSTGAKQSIFQTVMALVNPGDEVIIPAPYWVSYKEIVKVAEAKTVFIETNLENNFKVTAKQLEEHITPKTKLIMFSSPSNPTGMLYTKEELKSIADVLVKHPHVFVMADEIYEHINFEGKHESIAQFDYIKEQIITVNGVAKGFAMTGWRIGFIGAPLKIAQACNKLQGQVTSATCSIAQRATISAMELDPTKSKDIINMRNKFLERRDLMYKLLKEIPDIEVILPQGAFYFFPKVNAYYGKSYGKYTINNSNDLAMYLLYEANVALVPGVAFGDDNCIRFSYATSNELLIEAVRRIKEALLQLK